MSAIMNTKPELNAALNTSEIAAAYARVRNTSETLIKPLSAEDCCVQSMPDASPAKWHLAHVSWFFETFVLEAHEPNFVPHDPAFRVLFNSYYNGIGEQFPRPQRGLMTRPGLEAVLAYRAAIDQRMQALIPTLPSEVLTTIELGLHHEQQHQELLLMDIKHLLSLNPLSPAYAPGTIAAPSALDLCWTEYAEGLCDIGHNGAGFHYDNEGPQHRCWLAPYQLANRLITNAEYRLFIDDGAYQDPMLWLADGWACVNENEWRAPAYWRQRDGEWFEFTLHGEQPLADNTPVSHISYYEADAFARWAGARLPSEMEWEHAAREKACTNQNFSLHAAAAETSKATQFNDALWQWTGSSYLAYPGFKPAAGAIGEYNGKFMANQMTLRGGACITPPGHTRHSYRNFFYPHQRWAFSGIRLANDL